MRFSKLLLASAAIAAGGVGYYGFVSLFPAQTTEIVRQGNTSHSAASSVVSPVRFSGESNAPGALAPNLNTETAGVVFSPPEETAVIIAPQLASHENRSRETESLETRRQAASSTAHSEQRSVPAAEKPPVTSSGPVSAARTLVAFNSQPQQPKPQQTRADEPAPSAKPQPPKAGTKPVVVVSPDANPLPPAIVPPKRAGAIASAIPVNLPSPENPPSSDNPTPRLPKFFNEEAELYRTQYGEEAYVARMHEAALSPEPSAPDR